MAVFKATSYTKSKAEIKASVRYITRERGRAEEKARPKLFNADGLVRKELVDRMINEAKPGTYFYRLVISLDPKLEDTFKDLDLREITEQTMAFLEEKLKGLQCEVQFVAAEHDDRPHRHVHVLALLRRRLTVEDFAQLRQAATQSALAQRQERDLARRPSREQVRATRVPPPKASRDEGFRRGDVDRRSGVQAKPARIGHTCPRCGPGQTMKQLAEKVHWCPACKFVQKQDFTLELKGEEAEWER